MRLHVLSDLHLEFAPFTVPQLDADVVILAGDTAPGSAGVRWAREAFGARPVLYVCGNHEYYGNTLPGLMGELRSSAPADGLWVLENDVAVIGGARFLGCTLWSDFELAGSALRERSMEICARVVSDYRQIGFGDGAARGGERRLLPRDTLELHLRSRNWLREQLAQPFAGPTVVITHHAPLVGPRPQSEVLAAVAGAFASDLTGLMGGGAAALWVFGHVHRCVDVDIGGTRAISNQRGYPREPVDGFDPGLILEI